MYLLDFCIISLYFVDSYLAKNTGYKLVPGGKLKSIPCFIIQNRAFATITSINLASNKYSTSLDPEPAGEAMFFVVNSPLEEKYDLQK